MTVRIPPALALAFLESGPLTDEDVHDPCVYFGVWSREPRNPFRGGYLYESVDDGKSWQVVHRVLESCSAGLVTSWSPVAVQAGRWDRANVLTVTMEPNSASIYSVTPTNCARGRNRFWVGGEVLGAATVEPIGVDAMGRKTYELSMLLRGLRGTEDAAARHSGPGQLVVALDRSGLQRRKLPSSAIGQSRLYRIVPAGGVMDGALTVSHTLAARNLVPFAPTRVRATRDSSDNIAVTWQPRSRRVINPFSAQPSSAPDARQRRYEVDFLDVAEDSVTLRTGQPASLETVGLDQDRAATYSAAQQSADGLSPSPDSVLVRIYEVSEQVRRGIAAEVTV